MAEQIFNIQVINGPNLNLLGTRESNIYGTITLEEINNNLSIKASQKGHHLKALQSNSESELIESIHTLMGKSVDFMLINPAAFTHTSIAIRDSILAVQIPFIEIHLSNIYSRETFRNFSYFSDIAIGVVSGLGPKGYELALDYALSHCESTLHSKKTLNKSAP